MCIWSSHACKVSLNVSHKENDKYDKLQVICSQDKLVHLSFAPSCVSAGGMKLPADLMARQVMTAMCLCFWGAILLIHQCNASS